MYVGRSFVRAGVVLACGSLTVIDPKTNTAISTINIGASLEAGVVDDKGTVFVFGAENHEIVSIDAKTHTIAAHWPCPMRPQR